MSAVVARNKVGRTEETPLEKLKRLRDEHNVAKKKWVKKQKKEGKLSLDEIDDDEDITKGPVNWGNGMKVSIVHYDSKELFKPKKIKKEKKEKESKYSELDSDIELESDDEKEEPKKKKKEEKRKSSSEKSEKLKKVKKLKEKHKKKKSG